jgi:hypothetical protein
LRDEGSQWAPSFDSAVIEIQIVGRTYEWVRDQQAVVLGEIEQAVNAQQETNGPADNRLSAIVEPLTKRINHITYSRSTLFAGVGAMAAAALIVGAWVAVLAEGRVRRFRRVAPGPDTGAETVGLARA